jgi:hypothetical protein
LTLVDSAGFSSQPTDIMPWKRNMADHCGRRERSLEMSVGEVRSAAASSRLVLDDGIPAGLWGVWRSVRTTLLEESCVNFAASIGPRKPAPPVMRMVFDMSWWSVL